jgi:hypothetical protein
MKWPPMWIRVKIKNENTRFGIWLPLFLLWPLVLVLLIAFSPFIIIGIAVLWPSGWGKLAWLALRSAGSIICALHGLRVDVASPERNEIVYISVV